MLFLIKRKKFSILYIKIYIYHIDKTVFRRLYMNKDKKLQDVRLPSLIGDEHFQEIKT